MLSLLAKLGLDVSPFTRGLDAAKGAARKAGDQIASSFGSELKSSLFGGAAVGTFAAFGRQLIDEAGRINDLAEQYGLAVSEVQALNAAAEDSGLQFEKIGGAIDRLGSARKDAATKNEALREEFAKFGVTLADLQNPAKTNLDLLKQIGGALQGIEITPATREALGDLLGEKGQRLLEFIKGINEVKPLSLVTPDQISLLDKFGDRLAGVARSLKEIAAAKLADAVAKADSATAGMDVGFKRGAKGVSVFLATLFGGSVVNDGEQRTEPLTAQDVAKARAALKPGEDLFPPEPKSKSAAGNSVAKALSAASAVQAGGLASSGLFFGGAGSGLYREARQQTEYQRQTVAEIRRLQSVFREEL